MVFIITDTYHITWSIDSDSGYKPKDSKALLAGKQYTPTKAVPFRASPTIL